MSHRSPHGLGSVVPPLTVAVLGAGMFLLGSNDAKMQLLFILLMLAFIILLNLGRADILERLLLIGLGIAVVFNPTKYFFVNEHTVLQVGAAGYFFLSLVDLIVFCLWFAFAFKIIMPSIKTIPKFLWFMIFGFWLFLLASLTSASHMDPAWAQVFFEAKCLLLFLVIYSLIVADGLTSLERVAIPIVFGLGIAIMMEAGAVIGEYTRVLNSNIKILGITVGSFDETMSGAVQTLRVGGTYRHPNYLAVPAGALFLLFWQTQTSPLSQKYPLLWGALGAAFLCLLLPLSRGGWVATFAGFLLYSIVYSKIHGLEWLRRLPWRYITPGIVSAVLVIGAFAESIYSKLFMSQKDNIVGRVNLNAMAIDMITSNPILGVGAGNHSYAAANYKLFSSFLDKAGLLPVVHNTYLLISSEVGIAGAICYFSIPFFIIFYGVRACLRCPTHVYMPLVCALTTPIVVFLVADLFGPSLRKRDITYIFWLLLALALGTAKVMEKTNSHSAERSNHV